MASCSVLNTGQHAVSCIGGSATAVAGSTGEHFTFQKGDILSRYPNARQNQNLNKSNKSFENVKKSPVTGLEWTRRLHEVKVPGFHDNATGWW